MSDAVVDRTVLIRLCALACSKKKKKKKEGIKNQRSHDFGSSRCRVPVQLRLTHFLLNGYLKRIGRVDNARCPACGEDEEDITHYLLRCQNYVHKRWLLTQHAARKHKPLTLKTILGDP
jgi:hypothetical protein